MLSRMNYAWRLMATGFSFFLFGLGGVIVPVLVAPFIYLSSNNIAIRQVRARKAVHLVFRAFVNMMRLMGILSWATSGLERLQKPGILVLANHPTLLDIVFLVALIPNADCIVKSKLLTNPAMRGFLRLTGYLTNDDGETLVAQAVKSLNDDSALIIFPEGTRTVDGRALSFKRGAANIAVRGKVSPTPVIINCYPATLSKQHKWYHIPARRFHLSISVLEEINIDGFMELNASQAARQFTLYLEEFFMKYVGSSSDERQAPDFLASLAVGKDNS